MSQCQTVSQSVTVSHVSHSVTLCQTVSHSVTISHIVTVLNNVTVSQCHTVSHGVTQCHNNTRCHSVTQRHKVSQSATVPQCVVSQIISHFSFSLPPLNITTWNILHHPPTITSDQHKLKYNAYLCGSGSMYRSVTNYNIHLSHHRSLLHHPNLPD